MEGKQILHTIVDTINIKIKFNEDIRRWTSQMSDLQKLRNEAMEKYGLDPKNMRFQLKYEDEEGDLVTLATDADLHEALKLSASSKLLRLRICKRCNLHFSTVPEATVPTEVASPSPAAAEAPRNQAGVGDVPHTVLKHEWRRMKQQMKQKGGDREELKEIKHQMREQWRQQKEVNKARFRDDKEGKKALRALSKHSARYVKDLGLSEEELVAPGATFVKGWRFRNEGDRAWPEGCQIIFVSKLNGDQMGAPSSVPVPTANVGQEVDVTISMVAPAAPGRYVGYWRLCAPDGHKFGQRVRALIQVAAASDTSSSSPRSSSSSSSSEDEEINVEAAMAQLAEMGFHDRSLNEKLWKKHKGDLPSMVSRLVRRREKERKMQEKEARKKEKEAKKQEKQGKNHNKEEKKQKKEEKKQIPLLDKYH